MIFGRTDISRHFHPIVFFLTSHEQEVVFVYFLKMLVDLLLTAFNIQINFTFTYLMQDACQASCNGLKAVYPYVYVLMCWYHLKALVDIHIKAVQDSKVREDIICDINKLHFSWSHERFSHCFNEMLLKYVTFNAEHKMIDKEGKVGAAKFFEYFNG